MENSYKLVLTDNAVRDLDNIYLYIKEELKNTTATIELVTEIENKILHLKNFPKSCSVVEDKKLNAKGYRKLIIKNFIALYTVDEENSVVNIMRVIYGKRNYIDLILWY